MVLPLLKGIEALPLKPGLDCRLEKKKGKGHPPPRFDKRPQERLGKSDCLFKPFDYQNQGIIHAPYLAAPLSSNFPSLFLKIFSFLRRLRRIVLLLTSLWSRTLFTISSFLIKIFVFYFFPLLLI